MAQGPLLEARALAKDYPLRRTRAVKALRGVDLQIAEGEVLGLVGESGSGKSTLARCLLRLEEPTSGQVFFDGEELTGKTQRQLRPYRRQLQIVFQDPFLSLDPRMTVEAAVGEPLSIHRLGSRQQRMERVEHLLVQVGLDSSILHRFPHEFSGGQRQRIAIARALAAGPRLIIADEPVSALDVSVQAQILNLLLELKREVGLSYLFISHDLRVVEAVSRRVAVMYFGRIVEAGPPATLRERGRHPYTVALAAAAPSLEPARPGQPPQTALVGDVPNPSSPPTGCPFHPRCPLFRKRKNPDCIRREPELLPLPEGEHRVACHEVER
jgi:oligopeptide/dipeptide ABC transporter ATP-binding protein